MIYIDIDNFIIGEAMFFVFLYSLNDYYTTKAYTNTFFILFSSEMARDCFLSIEESNIFYL